MGSFIVSELIWQMSPALVESLVAQCVAAVLKRKFGAHAMRSLCTERHNSTLERIDAAQIEYWRHTMRLTKGAQNHDPLCEGACVRSKFHEGIISTRAHANSGAKGACVCGVHVEIHRDVEGRFAE